MTAPLGPAARRLRPAEGLRSGCRGLLAAMVVTAPLARGAVPDWAVTLIHMGVAGLVWLWLLAELLDPQPLRPTGVDRPLAVLLVWCLVSTLFSQHRPTSWEALWRLADAAAVFWLTVQLMDTRPRRRAFMGAILGGAVLLGLIAVLKTGGRLPPGWWHYPEASPPAPVLTGPFGNPNHLAGWLTLALPLGLTLAITARSTARRRLAGALTTLAGAALVLTLSRGGWIAAGAGLLFFMVRFGRDHPRRRRRVTAGGLAALLAAAAIFLAVRPVVVEMRSIETDALNPWQVGRPWLWRAVLDLIADHPVLGSGPGTFAVVFTQYQPARFSARRYYFAHNDYLQWAADAGPPVLLVIGWGLAALFKQGLRPRPATGRRSVTALAALAGVTGLAIHSVVDFNLHIPSNALLLAAVAALAIPGAPSARNSPGP